MIEFNKKCISALLAGGLMFGALQSASAGPDGTTYMAPDANLPMDQILQKSIYTKLDYFFKKLTLEKGDLRIDGVAPYESHDKFLPGKIAIGLGDILLNTPADDKRLPQYLKDFREIADLTINMENNTWGIYYYLSALYSLKKAGLLEQAVSPETLAILKQKLDWRKFVTESNLELIDLPANYYGVAFSVSSLRALMGWEDDSASKKLLAKMLEHYETYSGKFGFSDETPTGDGRFDRYSILLIAEICEHFVELGMPVTPDLKAKLRKTANLALNIGNTSGQGFSFGRSIGLYGETAILEILSISAYLDVLTPEEKKYAYTFATQIVARYMDFWYDPETHSVDMWGKGRRTDTYRAKHRILGENFSTMHQLITTNELWNKAGFKDKMPEKDLQAWLNRTQPPFNMIWFAKGEYDRALAIFRDKKNVFSLLMVNGGPGQANGSPGQHANSPYYPLPFSPWIIEGTADSGPEHAQLLPKFTLADGTQLMGTAYIKNIQSKKNGKQYQVSYRQDALDQLGKDDPIKDPRMKLETLYTLEPGKITRTDKYIPVAPLDVARVTLEFASFSDAAKVLGSKVHFSDGAVTDFEVSGLQGCQVEETIGKEPFKSTNGAMKTHVTCMRGHYAMKEPLTIKWVIKYH